MSDRKVFDDLILYCSSKSYRPDVSNDYKRIIRRKSQNFFVEKGELFRKDKSRKTKRRVIMDKVENIIFACHEGVGGGHFGVNKTVEKINERFYWESIRADTEKYIKSCDRCQRYNVSCKLPPAQLHPISVSRVWERCAIDLVGPLTETTKGNKYIVVLTDMFSNWPEAKAIADKTSESVSKFIEEVIYRHGDRKSVV